MKQICNHCKINKPLSEFHKDKSRKNGFYVVCKKCVTVYQKSIYKKCIDCGKEIWYSSIRCKTCDVKYRYKLGTLKPKKATNIIGKRFKYLVVTKAIKDKHGRNRWICNCDCGKTTVARTGDLNRGNAKSCGCKRFPKGKEHPLWTGGNTPESQRNRELNSLYGISLKDYQQMLKNQNGVCAICGKAETRKANNGKTRVLSVDHNHQSGKVRALLCCDCNQALGMLKDNIRILNNMIKYLFKYER